MKEFNPHFFPSSLAGIFSHYTALLRAFHLFLPLRREVGCLAADIGTDAGRQVGRQAAGGPGNLSPSSRKSQDW